jgi:hypothetical protein
MDCVDATEVLDHPGTERPPVPDVHNRLEDAHYLWLPGAAQLFQPAALSIFSEITVGTKEAMRTGWLSA